MFHGRLIGLTLRLSLLLVVTTACTFSSEYYQVFEEIERRANDGDRLAQNEIGKCYYYGIAVGQNYEKAFEWFEKAADNDYSLGQYNLSLCYLRGEGTSKDLEKAIMYLQKSANQGCSKAEMALGCLSLEGIGVKTDIEKAKYWLEKAANQGVREAMYMLGNLYLDNQESDDDGAKALYWIRRSAYYGMPEAQYHYGYLFKEGSLVARDRDKYYRWVNRAVLNGYNYFRFGEYYTGVGLIVLTQTKEPITDKTYLLQPLDEKDIKTEASALYQQGFKLLFTGNEGQQNQEAIKCLIRSTLKGNKSEKILLSYCYATGIGTLVDQSAPSVLFVGKARIRYEDSGGYTTIDFEIFEDGSFEKKISWKKEGR